MSNKHIWRRCGHPKCEFSTQKAKAYRTHITDSHDGVWADPVFIKGPRFARVRKVRSEK